MCGFRLAMQGCSYSSRMKNASTRAIAADFARCAAGVVTNIARLAELERVNRQLAEALTSRDVIGQAKGILRERLGYSGQEAFDELRRSSQRERRKLRTVAEAILDSVGRGRMR